MNTINKFLFILLGVILFIVLYKTISNLAKIETYENATQTPDIIPSDKQIPITVSPTSSQLLVTSKKTNQIPDVNTLSKTTNVFNKVDDKIIQRVKNPIYDKAKMADFKEVEEEPLISAQGDVLDLNASHATKQETKQEDILIEPRYYDRTTKSILDGIKVDNITALSPWAAAYTIDSNEYLLDTGDDLDGGSMRYTKRSPACCSPTFPPPFKIKIDDEICEDKDKYYPSIYTGSDNWSDAGCACVLKSNIMKLAHRGGNA